MGISVVEKAVERDCSFIPASVVTMCEQEEPLSFTQRIIIEFFVQENVESAEFFRRLTNLLRKNFFRDLKFA